MKFPVKDFFSKCDQIRRKLFTKSNRTIVNTYRLKNLK